MHESESGVWSGEPGYLPTLAFQDGTLEQTREELEQGLALLASAETAGAL